jgi:hypothetical protein
MEGCMVAKVPKLLRRRRGRGAAPDRPQVIGYDRYIRFDITECHWIKEGSGHGVYAGAPGATVRPFMSPASRVSVSRSIVGSSRISSGMGVGAMRLWQGFCNRAAMNSDNQVWRRHSVAAFCGVKRRLAASRGALHARPQSAYASRHVPSMIVTEDPPIQILPRASS